MRTMVTKGNDGMKRLAKIYLRKSEKYLKTDMTYLARGGFWIGLAQVITTASGLVLTVAFANLLSQEAFGIYKFLLTLGVLISALSLTGSKTTIIRSIARGADGTLYAAMKEYFKWSVGMLLAGIAGAIYYFINDNPTIAFGLLVIGALLPIKETFALHNPYLTGKQNFRAQSLYNIPGNFLVVGALLVTIFYTNNPLVVTTVYFTAQTIVAVLLFVLIIKRYPPQNDRVDDGALTFGKHLSLMDIFAKGAKNLDKILIFHYFGAAQLAVYTFAIAPIREISQPKKLIASLVLPKLSKRSLPELKASLPRRVLLAMVLLLPLVIAYVALAPLIFELLFPKYMESVVYSQVFSLSLLLLPASIFSQTLTAHMKHRHLYITKTITPVISISLLLILLPLYGIWGGIFAFLITRTTVTGIVIFLLYTKT